MRSNGSRVPLRTSTSIYSVGHNYNYEAYQAFIDNQNAQVPGSNWSFPGFNGPSPAAQDRVPSGLLSPSATPRLISTVFADDDTHWLPFMPPGPSVSASDCQASPGACEDDGLCTLNSSIVKSSYPSYTTTPACDLSLSLLANKTAGYETCNWHLSQKSSFDSPLAAATPTAPAYGSSLACGELAYGVDSWQLGQEYALSPAATTPASSTPSRPYQCSSCPDTPTFSSLRDLKRHMLAKAHWNDVTQFYRCCCRAQSARKDHHRRHLGICDGLAFNPYACKCGLECSSRDEHIEHIEDCGRRRRRRQQSTAP
ncbi:hypothetical protein F4680DRAFT_221615 [Xylaria scruposa]|nr:hypothetical protein F4680DRAFT_221615 [Xylaria scruposa]